MQAIQVINMIGINFHYKRVVFTVAPFEFYNRDAKI